MQTELNSAYAQVEYLREVGEELPRYHSWIANMIHKAVPVKEGKRFMDFGCGAAVLSIIFRERFGILPIAVELDAALRHQCKEAGFEVHRSLADVSIKLDVIFSSNVLEHIEDDVQMLCELRNHLVPGGRLILFLPAMPILWSNMDVTVGHYRRYTRAELRRRVTAAGFEVINCNYKDSAGFFATLAFKMLSGAMEKPSIRSLKIYDRWILPASKIGDLVFGRLFGKNVFLVATAKPN